MGLSANYALPAKLLGMKMRIKQLRKNRGIKQFELAEAADLSRPYMSALETGNVKKSPSMETLTKIANVLDVRIGDLFDDAKLVWVAAKVGAGAKVPVNQTYSEGDGLYKVACPTELTQHEDLIGVEVSGESMTPVYKDGDVLFYTRTTVGVPTEAIGSICVCEDADGNGWVKHLKLGSEKGLFNLISLNPFSDNILDVRLKWASPVRLPWPKELVQKAEI